MGGSSSGVSDTLGVIIGGLRRGAPAQLQSRLKGRMDSRITRSAEVFMRAALAQADEAERLGRGAVGAVIVKDGEVVAVAGNAPISTTDPTAHAEILALREASRRRGNYRLPGTTMYVTVEPCAMCAERSSPPGLTNSFSERETCDSGPSEASSAWRIPTNSTTELKSSKEYWRTSA